MKYKKRLFVILTLTICLIVSSCGIDVKRSATLEPSNSFEPENLSPTNPIAETSPTPEPEPTPDYSEIYREKLDYFYNILKNGIENWDYGKGEVGLMEIANYNPENEALASVGYVIRDISGDGIPELLIVNVSNPGESPAIGASILALFSSSDGTPTLTFEGWSRSHYLYFNQNKVYHFGSNGATNHVHIINKLSVDGKDLECLNYYIAQPKENDPQTEGYFQDPKCGQGQSVYEELDLDFDSFKQMIQDQLGPVQEFELTPFSDYSPSPQAASDITEPAVKIQWAEEALHNFTSYDTFTADESEYQVKLLISSSHPLKNFNFLRLTIDGVDDTGNLNTTTGSIYHIDTLMPDRPLVVAMTFYGDLPSYGISFEDESGQMKSYYITQSGQDGSLMLIEFN